MNNRAIIEVVALKIAFFDGLRIIAYSEIDDSKDALMIEFLTNSLMTLSIAI